MTIEERVEKQIRKVAVKYNAEEPRSEKRVKCNLVIVGDVRLNYRPKRNKRRNNNG